MAITYTWEVTSLKVKDVSDTKANAVVQTYWKKIGTDENGNTGTFSGATPFTVDPTDNSGPFIDRKSTRLNSSHVRTSRMPSSA